MSGPHGSVWRTVLALGVMSGCAAPGEETHVEVGAESQGLEERESGSGDAGWRRGFRSHRVVPMLTCVEELGDGVLRAHWGYKNGSNRQIRVRVGSRNHFFPGGRNQGQLTRFEPGVHEDVFTTDFVPTRRRQTLMWRLQRGRARASAESPRCSDACVPADCDDGDPCTDVGCGEDSCEHAPAQDGTSCGVGMACQGGECVELPTGCASDADCDNGDLCDGMESCEEATGTCQAGAPLACEDDNPCNGDEMCDPAAGCTSGQALDCEDGNPCTANACDPVTGCTASNVPDLTPCGEGLVCVGGSCVAGGCSEDADCDDGSVCNGAETCVDLACQAGQPLSCDDGNVCNGAESCDPVDGCQTADPLDCDDGNLCTADSCDPASGCGHDPVSDGTVCGEDLACMEGTCVPVGCASDEACDDGNVCNGAELCVDNGCQPGEALDCDDGDACNGEETCSPAEGCTDGAPLSCDDSEVCTADSCDAGDGCVHDAVEDGTTCGSSMVCMSGECVTVGCIEDADCDDGDLCDGAEVCVDNACEPGEPLDCDDGDACNGAEGCSPSEGCTAGTPLACDDGNLCNGQESCDQDEGCQDGTALDCDDLNECTADACSPDGGCENEAVSDGTACDGGEGVCTAGVCGPAGPCPGGGEPTELVLSHVDRGSFNSADVVSNVTPRCKVVNSSYQARSFNFAGLAVDGDGNPLQVEPGSRAYFTFDLSGVSGEVLSASLRISQSGSSYDSPDSTETVTFYEVATPSADLAAIPAGADNPADCGSFATIFDDLGDGPQYGDRELSEADNSSTVTVALNAAAVASLDDASGQWSVGADVTTLGSTLLSAFGFERVWRASEGTDDTELVLGVCQGN